MTNLKPVRVKVGHGEAIPPHEFIPCDCVTCRESQESEFVVTYARVLIELMGFPKAWLGERKEKGAGQLTAPTPSK